MAKPSTQADSMIDLLTLREREITVLPAKSDMSKEVAAKLNISTKTAENHRTNLMRKPGSTMSQASSAMSSGKAFTTPAAKAEAC
ncbi:hypothetical protein EMGBS8_00050 [Verrucomicrobiota bacterium]|nr:hypothetical protein EMGBS8_00050 [Verrucomicrobiota bacterium]